MDREETIAALATAPGPGARAVIRLSGPTAIAAVQRLSTLKMAERGSFEESVQIPTLGSPLPVRILVMPGPLSYTGQDCVELHFVSSPPIVDAVLEELLSTNVRAARPGEFTMRAFLAGKKDLTQAEAVHAVIAAESEEELRTALGRLAGNVSQPLLGIRDDLLNLLADVEAGLDFADEDIQFVDKRDLLLRLGAAIAHMINVRRRLDERGVSGRPFRVAIIGEPNTGKSSLLNALTGSAAAIVSPVAGTTRDYVSHTLTMDGVALELIDTAGLRVTPDAIEEAAQVLGSAESATADLRIRCVRADVTAGESIVAEWVGVEWTVLTMADRGGPIRRAIQTSAVTGEGIERLRSGLVEQARRHQSRRSASDMVRCRAHVEKGIDHLRSAHQAVLFDDPNEILALELRAALHQMGELVGAVHTEDLLDRIFSRFCIGK